jgi:ATP-dependent 26S proteasome regulatory subunit
MNEKTLRAISECESVEKTTISPEGKKSYTSWIVESNNQFIPTLELITIPKLSAGKYSIKWNDEYHRYMFVKEKLQLDELLDLPNPIFNSILKDIDYFWDHKDLFKKYKFAYKRGILLHGKPGCGKSSITALLSNQVIAKGGIVLSINNSRALETYLDAMSTVFRTIEPDTPVLALFEDLDGLTRDPEIETMLLNILDGMNQSENVVNIGCTNYPEKLKERILNRPSRFDKRYYIGLPDASVRKYYFEHKILQEDIEERGGEKFISKIVSETEGLTIAHLGEFIKSVFIFGNDVSDSIATLKNMEKNVTSYRNEDSKTIGFSK